MSEADRERWEARWAQRAEGPGEPEPYLVAHAAALPPGPILVPAAGAGRNALWLARQGRAVTALDIAPTAIARLQAAARAQGLSVATRVADLDDPGTLTGLGPFAALAIIRFRPAPEHWPRLLGTLGPGGSLLLSSFAPEEHRRTGFPRRFCLDRNDLERELAPMLKLARWDEHTLEGVHLAGSIWQCSG